MRTIFNCQLSIFNLIKHPLFSGSFVMVAGSTLANILSYFNHLVLGRLLGPSEYGELVTLISFSGLLAVIPVSTSLAVTKYVSISKEDDKSLLINWFSTVYFKLSLIIFILLIILVPVISSFLHLSNINHAIIIAVIFLFSFPTIINRAILQGLLKFKENMISILIEFSTRFSIAILLVYLGYRVGGAIFGFLVAAIVSWFQTKMYLKRYLKKNIKRPNFVKSIIKYTIPVVAQSIAMLSLISSDIILVKHFFSSYDTGIYAALSVLGRIIFFGAGPIGAVMFPLVAQRNSKGMKVGTLLILSFLATLAVAVFFLLIYWLFPNFAISLLYGKSYLEASDLLIWFGIFITLYTFSALLLNFQLSLGRIKIVFLPILAALLQIIAIWFYHEDLMTVILISILVNALLLACLLIYSSNNEKFFFSRIKINFNNSPSI